MKGSLISSAVAEPYAEALMSLAQSQNAVDAFGEVMRNILDIWNNSQDFQGFLTSPLPKPEDKKAVLRRISEGTNPLLVNFLQLLVDRRRIMYLDAIASQYLERLRKIQGTVLASVTSTVQLTEAQQQAVIDKVKSLTGAAGVELSTTIDPDLIGGVIIKVGSQVYDASLRGQLRRLTYNLLNAE